MASRTDLARLKQVQKIRQVRRADAEQIMADARRSREIAVGALERCCTATEQADTEWRQHLAAGAFDPLFSRGLADRIMLRVSEQEQATTRVEAAGRVVEHREQNWRLRDAEQRASDRNLKQAASCHARTLEERRCEALADRVTYQWVKP